MQITERSYNSKMIRPKPIIHVEGDGSLIIIATVWGYPEHGQRVIEEISKYMGAAKADVEVTSPFEFLSCLPDEVNYVRTATLIANDTLYRGENKSEYLSGVEILVVYRRGRQIAWAQVGAPALFVKKPNLPLQPLSSNLDLAVELSRDQILSPLPSQLMGLEPTCDIKVGHFYARDEDQLVVMASGQIGESLWKSENKEMTLPDWTRGLVQENPELPFWLGVISLKD